MPRTRANIAAELVRRVDNAKRLPTWHPEYVEEHTEIDKLLTAWQRAQPADREAPARAPWRPSARPTRA